MMVMRKLLFIILLLLSMPLAVASPVPEYTMKAAFLYNFASLTEWPLKTGDSVRLCVVGQDPISTALKEIDNRFVNGKALQVVHLSDLSLAKECQILYLSEFEVADIKVILGELGDAPVLTVSDNLDMEKSGIMITMFSDSQRLAFSVNATSAKRAHLTLSSKLLRLAKHVD